MELKKIYLVLPCSLHVLWQLLFYIDGSDNANPNNLDDEFYTGKSILVVQATGGFTITNSDGSWFHYAHGETTGNLELLGTDFTVLGPDVPSNQLFLVSQSENFECIAEEDSEILAFSIINGPTSSNTLEVNAASVYTQEEQP